MKIITDNNIVFPVAKEKECERGELFINQVKSMSLGEKIQILKQYTATCIHIEDQWNKRLMFFSYDELPIKCTYNQLNAYLKEIYNTGYVNETIKVMPKYILDKIDFFFIPTEYQIFGKNEYAKEIEDNTTQFDWYTLGRFYKIKGYEGEPHWYWLSNESKYSTTFCVASNYVLAYYSSASNLGGLPIFFQITIDC